MTRAKTTEPTNIERRKVYKNRTEEKNNKQFSNNNPKKKAITKPPQAADSQYSETEL